MGANDNRSCILIADDDEDDQAMMASAFCDTGFLGTICKVSDGQQVLDYLRKSGAFVSSITPSFVMLDLNMPKKDGREVLKELRKHPELARIPIIVYSTSNNPRDIAHCYELGANSFITKPPSYDQLKKIVIALQEYWLEIVKIPQEH